jgi:Putative peptidoglycan binding domain
MNIRHFVRVCAVICGIALGAGLSLSPAAAASTATKKKPTSTTASSSKKSSTKRHSSRRGKRSKKTASWRRGQQRIDADRAREIQEALVREHYLPGKASGTWDAASQRAMEKFQADNGWQTKVVPDLRALIKLGLGPNHDHLLNPESAMTGPIPSRSATARPDPPPSSPITPVSTDPASTSQPQQ